MLRLLLVLLLLAPAPALARDGTAGDKWIVSTTAVGALPPGSLTAVAVTLERGAEAIKLDLVLSRDDQVMVLADPLLNELTDVAVLFPERARDDGNWYALDFDLAELRLLSHRTATAGQAEYQGRGNGSGPRFPVRSLTEILATIEMMRPAPTAPLAIVCELRQGWLHRRENKDLAGAVLDIIGRFSASAGTLAFHIASYDPDELNRLAEDRPAGAAAGPQLIQLVTGNDDTEVMTRELGGYRPYNYDWLFTRFGLKAASAYTDALGLKPEVVLDSESRVKRPEYLDDARALGLQLFLYPAAAPAEAAAGYYEYILFTAGFDGLLSADEDRVRARLEQPRAGGRPDSPIDELIEQLQRRRDDAAATPPEINPNDQ